MKKYKWLLFILVFLVSTLTVEAKINYVEQNNSKSSTTVETQNAKQEDELEAINQAEGLQSEQIIIQISAEGFVASHGDHYHYYNGYVPSDAIFSEKLLVDADYDFNEKDIFREIDHGYIVKVNNKYLVYFEDLSKVTSIRTDVEIRLQANGLSPEEAKNVSHLPENYQLPDSEIKDAGVKTESEVLKEEHVQDSLVVYILEEGYVALINHQFYIFHQSLPEGAKLAPSLSN